MTIKVGLVGTGTVGCGCIDILQKHQADFARHYGADIELVSVCSRNPEAVQARGLGDIFTPDYREVIANPEVQIVIELIGGTTVAKDVIIGALNAGKDVVTANKAVMASFGEEIMALAEKQGCEVQFEASVGGGIPIIGPLKHSLIANEVSSIMGIVNGTTNYMLTRMSEDGLSYDEALREAQEKGFAEADPTADVDGFDAAAKIAILASIAFNSRVTLSDVYCEGIRNVSSSDMKAARDMGYAIKLVALAQRTPTGIAAHVHPTMIPLEHQMAKVNGVYNAIYVTGDAVGETMFFGEGAGAGPAASAVMGDLLEVVRRKTLGIKPLLGSSCTDNLPVVPMAELETKFYLRFLVADRSGVLAQTAKVFADYQVSVQSVAQTGTRAREAVELVFLTHTASESAMKNVIDGIMALDDVVVGGYPSVIRVV